MNPQDTGEQKCDACGGSGSLPFGDNTRRVCSACHGTGRIPQTRKFDDYLAEKLAKQPELGEHIERAEKDMLSDNLSTLYAKVRAGRDPDTGKLHITEHEFVAAILAIFNSALRAELEWLQSHGHGGYEIDEQEAGE